MKSMPDGLSPFEAKREEDPCGLRPISRQKLVFTPKTVRCAKSLLVFSGGSQFGTVGAARGCDGAPIFSVVGAFCSGVAPFSSDGAVFCSAVGAIFSGGADKRWACEVLR